MSMNGHEKTSVIGFDLGHGETALAFLEDASSTRGLQGFHPQPVFSTARSQPTFMATIDDGRTVWGEKALHFPKQQQIDISFKAKPGRAATDSVIRKFATCVHGDAMRELNGKTGDRIAWFVGCPSAWDEKTQEAYQDLFVQAGFQGVSIVKESRAAFTYYYEKSDLSLGSLNEPALVLDFGSSTLDVTLALGVHDKELDPGCPLGASWIDKAILTWNLRNSPEGPAIAQFLAENQSIRNRVEFDVRKLKESYFNKEEIYVDAENCLEEGIRVGNQRMWVQIHGQMMHDLLNTPLEKVVPELTSADVPSDVRSQLIGHSWVGFCRKFLTEQVLKLQEYQIDPRSIRHVLLTGGASRMGPVRRLVEELFGCGMLLGNIERDPEPEMCIARGLACWGRTLLQTEVFRSEAVALLLDENRLLSIIEAHAKAVGLEQITNDKWAGVALAELRGWRNGHTSHKRVGPRIAEHMRKWSKSGDLHKAVRERVSILERALRKDVNDLASPLLQRYQIASVGFLGETLLFDSLIEYFTQDCEHIAELMSKTEFSHLGDSWLERKLFVFDDNIKDVVESTRREWVEVDIKNLRRNNTATRSRIIDGIRRRVWENIEKSIEATRFLLTAGV